MNDLKPGMFTTEFWTNIITQIVGLLVLTGHLGSSDAPALTQALIMVFTGMTMAITAITYIWSRFSLKKAMIENNTITTIAASQPATTFTGTATTTPSIVTTTPLNTSSV